MQFTPEQTRAIDIARLGENACIVAGPGSGKTTVLVERYRQLIATGIQPAEILAITYTEKAAQNMRERLALAFAGDGEMLRKLDRANVATIHGFCHRLLKENATAAGVDPEFTILDEQLGVLEQARALRETLDAMMLDQADAMRALLDALKGADLEGLMPGIYDAMRAGGVRPQTLRQFFAAPATKPSLDAMVAAAERYIDGFPAMLNASQRTARENALDWVERLNQARGNARELFAVLSDKRSFNLQVNNRAKEDIKRMRADAEEYCNSLLDEIFAGERETMIALFEQFDARYRNRKAEMAALDFNDLEAYAVRLLEENPEVRRQVNADFRQVMIDEFQDTSPQQARLVELVHGPGRFYAVGDLNQSIYSFRHASPAVFRAHLASVSDSQGHCEELVENWRSREAVLLATKKILQGASGVEERALVPARALPDREHPSIEVLIAACAEDDDSYELEAEWVVSRILELRETLRIIDRGEERAAKLSDFAILVRNTNVLTPFREEFTARGVAFNLNRRTGFFETPEARNLTHLLRMIRNPRDEVSTLTVLRSDLAGISDEGLLRLKLQYGQFAEGLDHGDLTLLDADDQQRMERFRAAYQRWRALAASVAVDALITAALDEVGLPWDARTEQGKNIEKFLNVARAYPEMTLGEFLAHIEAMRDTDPREADSPVDETLDAVQIMSTHAAKGLEFPVVILATLEKGVEAGQSPALNFTPQHGLGLKWCMDGNEDAVSGRAHARNKEFIKKTEEEESNRLFYVALTRAEEHLILSWTRKPDAKPKNWAKTVTLALGLEELAATGEPELRRFTAPNGREFDVRMICTMARPFSQSGEMATRTLPAPEVLPRPDWTGQLEPNTTATALSLFASCPRKYYLSGYLGWNRDLVRPRAAGSSAREFTKSAAEIGTEVHALLAGEEVIRPDWEATRLARVFEKSALGKRAYRAKKRESEWDFIFPLESLIVRGKIDLWFEDAQGLTIVDYKTDDVAAEQAAARSRDYFGQLQLYAVALERAVGKKPAAAWLHFLRSDIARPVPLEEAEPRMIRLAHEFEEAQERLEFPLRSGPHCRTCPFYRNICPARLASELPEVNPKFHQEFNPDAKGDAARGGSSFSRPA